jgi:hypothetical protein
MRKIYNCNNRRHKNLVLNFGEGYMSFYDKCPKVRKKYMWQKYVVGATFQLFTFCNFTLFSAFKICSIYVLEIFIINFRQFNPF